MAPDARSLDLESPTTPERPEKRPRLAEQERTSSVHEARPPMDVNSTPNTLDASKYIHKDKKRKQKRSVIEPYSPDDILYHDVVTLLNKAGKVVQAGKDWDAPLSFGTEIELMVSELSSNGDSLSVLPSPHPPWVVAVPFALPGERIRARVYRNARLVSMADLVNVESANEALRDMERVKCKYFGRCAGCQYQMMSYADQLDFKRKVIDKAYQNFSSLSPELVPPTLSTIASPKVYGYRTKITPHFDIPPKSTKGARGKVDTSKKQWELRIGFAQKGRRSVLDIEECPIATPVLNQALESAREGVQQVIETYKRGATLLLRDSLVTPTMEPSLKCSVEPALPATVSGIAVEASSNLLEQHTCVTDHKAIVRERVGEFLFEFPAGSFFQNNNSILEPLTSYVRDVVLDPPASLPTHLVDAYCGSGLFAITLSPHFCRVAGIEISVDSIRYARHNASLNSVSKGKCVFHTGQAEAIFESVSDFPPAQTVVVVDPPRKGCDQTFMDQLVAFGPATVVYVSCNVHTQARDVGIMLGSEGAAGTQYKLESLIGFDLFPQTAHVESIAVLRRI